MFVTVKKWTLLYIGSVLLLFLCFSVIFRQGSSVQTMAVPAAGEGGADYTLILDAGHGGEDGGAVAADGTEEADINLAIALAMEDSARLLGIQPVLTRREDISVHNSSAVTLREKKVSDLKNRAALCAETPGSVLVSIHQNMLPGSPGVGGAQVFYNGLPGSQELAAAIQTALNAAVNQNHPKSPKEIGSGVYLMEHAGCPAVIVECGFLSNPGETAQLKDPAYQKKVAVVILSAVVEHLSKTP